MSYIANTVSAATILNSSAFGRSFICYALAGNYTISLPNLNPSYAGNFIKFIVSSNSTGTITLDAGSGKLIDNSQIKALTIGQIISLQNDGEKWTSLNAESDSMGLPSGIDYTETITLSGGINLDNTHFNKVLICENEAISGDYTVVLPPASASKGKLLHIQMSSSLASLITIDAGSDITIDGQQTRVMWKNEVAILLCDGTNWTKVGGKSNPMICKVTGPASPIQYFSTSVWTALNLEIMIDGNNPKMFDSVNKRIKIARTGHYNITVYHCMVGSASFFLGCPVNTLVVSAEHDNGYSSIINSSAGTFSTYMSLNKNDWLSGSVYLMSGDNRSQTYMSARPHCCVSEIVEW